MPIVEEHERTMFASCRDSLCPGAAQVEVRGVESHVSFTYGELSGGKSALTPQEQMTAHLPEREAIHYRFVDMADEPCPHCGTARVIDPQERPVYEPKTGLDPLLLRKRELGLDQEKADRESALAIQREQLAEAKRANDLREREIAARERELAAAAQTNGHDDEDEAPRETSRPRPKAKA